MRKIEGIKYGAPMEASMPQKVHYPRLNLDLKHIPEAKGWKVGETYHVTLEVRQADISITKTEQGESGHVCFDITGIEPSKAPKKKALPDRK